MEVEKKPIKVIVEFSDGKKITIESSNGLNIPGNITDLITAKPTVESQILFGKPFKEKRKKYKRKSVIAELPPSDLAQIDTKYLRMKGKDIRRMRVENNILNKKLAKKAGLHISTLSKYELGRTTLSEAARLRFVYALQKLIGT